MINILAATPIVSATVHANSAPLSRSYVDITNIWNASNRQENRFHFHAYFRYNHGEACQVCAEDILPKQITPFSSHHHLLSIITLSFYPYKPPDPLAPRPLSYPNLLHLSPFVINPNLPPSFDASTGFATPPYALAQAPQQ